MQATTDNADTTEQTGSAPGVYPEASLATDGADGCCADRDIPCFDHFDHRCPNGQAWCANNGDGDGATGAVCLSCAGFGIRR